MNHSDSIVSVYSDARTEYTKQLCVFLVPSYFRFFLGLIERAKQVMTNEPKKVLWQFQTYLAEVPEWNMEKVSSEIDTIQKNCGCEYLEDLLTAVFIAHTKVLTAIRVSSKQKKVQITVPKVEHFLFRVLCESSKLLWSSSYLFRDGIPSIEKQQNYRTVEGLLSDAIMQAVRGLVPVKSILKDFVSLENEDEQEEHAVAQATMQTDTQTVAQTDVHVTEPPAPSNNVEGEGEGEGEGESESESEKEEEISAAAPPAAAPVTTSSELTHTPAPMIIVDTDNGVNFTDFDAVFDTDNPEQSDMIFEPKDGDDNSDDGPYEAPGIRILEETGVPLDGDSELEDLNNGWDDAQSIASNEYDTL